MTVSPIKGIELLGRRLSEQGLRVTFWWAADHVVRIITGAPIRQVSQITPNLFIGGQYRGRGWRRLASWGITAVVNLRVEYDDRAKGIAPPRYLALPAPDDHAPSLDQLRRGVAFIAEEAARGGAVYVHCGSGVGRAPTLAACYLVETGLSPRQAWELIRSHRPFVRPNQEQRDQVERFASSL